MIISDGELNHQYPSADPTADEYKWKFKKFKLKLPSVAISSNILRVIKEKDTCVHKIMYLVIVSLMFLNINVTPSLEIDCSFFVLLINAKSPLILE